MATITAELLPQSAAVRLSVWALSGIQSLVRRDANGINDVRTLPGVIGTPPVQVEDARNLVQHVTTGTNYVPARATIAASTSSYTRGTATGGGSTYVYYNGFLGGSGASAGMLPAAPGDQLAGSVALRNPNAVGIQAKLHYYYYDAAAALLSYEGGPMLTLAANATGTAKVTVTAPANTAYVRTLVNWYTAAGASPAAGLLLDWKYMVAYKGPAAWANNDTPFFHGSSTDTDTYHYAWAGASYASESIRYRQESAIIFTDYEPASGPLRYDLVNGSGELVSLDVPGFALDAPWLFTPLIPGYSRQLVSVRKIGADLENLSTVHSGLLGREDPIVVMRPLGMRNGTLDIWAGSYAAALEILSPLKQATAMMLRQPEHQGLDMYFAPLGASLIHEDQEGAATTWGVQVHYQEIKRPEGPIAGALGWTYADLEGAAARYQDLPRLFATYADMRLNKRKP